MMGKLFVEEALQDHHHPHHQDSLEEKVTVFLDSNCDDRPRYLCMEELGDSDSGGSDSIDPAERSRYWESQEALLQEILERYGSTGSKLREEVIESVREAREAYGCSCQKPSSDCCMSCLRRQVVHALRQKGFNSTLCTSKWKPTKKFPAGTHEYTELVVSTRERKKQVRLVIELEFREQFEIAKACEEYVRLVNLLPEVYVGKAEFLRAIVRVLCEAAEKSMKEKNLHVGPWRRSSFVQMKWSNASAEKDQECLRFCAAPAAVVTHGFPSHTHQEVGC